MKTIHLILNAHIDPIWLWGWESGIDEVLATCRSACDRLDAHPDIVFTRGEAWVYRTVQMLDPALFERVHEHVNAGRWEIVGGWWIQPDCNQPSGWAMEKQISIGKEYFEREFGQFPRIAYNVDSFGHAATLPALMRAAGQDKYIFMRPMKHEKTLPTNVFRWRGYADGPEVTTFRIPNSYTVRDRGTIEHVNTSLEGLPDGVEHTMSFMGVGDHGGGPTEEQIAWCREHARDIDGWEMKFSSPSRYFQAIQDQIPQLPLVTGELQMHAIGCYSVYRPIKTALRRAEHLMTEAEVASKAPEATGLAFDGLGDAWEQVCFHQFHDTLGGTCLPSAYVAVLNQLGSAMSTASDLVTYTLRRKLTALPDDLLQRLVFWNPSETSFDGFVEAEPWLEWILLQKDAGLEDKAGKPVPYQLVAQESAFPNQQRLLLPLKLAPNEIKAIKIVPSGAPAVAARVEAAEDRLSNNSGVAITADLMEIDGFKLPRPALHLIRDDSDTWSHNCDRYSDEIAATSVWKSKQVVDRGPLMASWIERGEIAQSEITAEWRVYADSPYVTLDLEVDYNEKHYVLKLTLPLGSSETQRTDGILGGNLIRQNDGAELCVRDWTLIGEIGIVCPDVFAMDATPERARFTLLRSPLMAHDGPYIPENAIRGVYTDQAKHKFRFRFYAGASATADILENAALSMERPPRYADLTRGMVHTRQG